MERSILSSDPLNRPCGILSRLAVVRSYRGPEVALTRFRPTAMSEWRGRQANGSDPALAHQRLQPAGHEVDKHVKLLIRQGA